MNGVDSATSAKTSFASSDASTAAISRRTRASSKRPALHPRPDLRTRDLGCRRVLHQVVDRRRADALQPGIDVANADADVDAQPVVGDLAARDVEVEQLLLSHLDVVAAAVELVRPLAEHGVELVPRDRDEIRMGDPRAVEAVARLAPLVLADLRERDRVHLGIAP